MGQRSSIIPPIERIRWLEAVSAYADTIPAYGLVQVTGVDSSGVLQVTQPSVNGQDVYVVGESDIPQSGSGVVTLDWPWLALYESGDGTPAVGDVWGAGASSFKLRKNNRGFNIEGGVNSSKHLVMVRRKITGTNGTFTVCDNVGTKTVTVENGIITSWV